MNPDSSTALVPYECRMLFGSTPSGPDSAGGSPYLRVGLPVLAGSGFERLLTDTSEPVNRAGFTVFGRDSLYAGFATATPGTDLETAARELYERLFQATA